MSRWARANVVKRERRWVLGWAFPFLTLRDVWVELWYRKVFRRAYSGHTPENWITQTRWQRMERPYDPKNYPPGEAER